MKIEDLRKQSIKELDEQLTKDQAKLAEFVLDTHTKEVKNVRQGRHLKKEIARIKTIIREKEQENG